MPYAWIENGAVRDIAPGNPAELYHPDVAALYDTVVPEGTERGATLVAGVWTNPLPPPPPAPSPPPEPTFRKTLTAPEFKLLFTSSERIAIRMARAYSGADANAQMVKDILDDFYEILDDPRLQEVNLNLPQTQEGVMGLVAFGILTETRATIILQGVDETGTTP